MVLVVVSSLGVSRARNIPAATYVTRGGVAIFVFVTKNRAFFVVKTFFLHVVVVLTFQKYESDLILGLFSVGVLRVSLVIAHEPR